MEGDLEELILIRDLRPGLFPQDRTCDLGERGTAGDRCEPLGPMACGPNVDQARSLAGAAALRVADLGWQGDPHRLPPTSEPRLAIALFRGSPGGVWARDIPLCRRCPWSPAWVPQRPARSNHAHDHGLSSVWSRTLPASGPPRPGPDRPAGRARHGTADQAWRRDHLLLLRVGSPAASTQRERSLPAVLVARGSQPDAAG